MIIDELIKKKDEKIEEHKKSFSDINEEDITFEMFQKKYEGSYYKKNPFSLQPFINKLDLPIDPFQDNMYIDTKSLPRLTDKMYNEIKNFPDYDYLNSVAYEMLIRTSEYKSLRDDSDAYGKEERKKRFDQLGIDIDDVFNFKSISNYYGSKKSTKNFTNAYLSMTLKDIGGLDRLIQFYVNKKQIYILDNENKIQSIVINRTYKAISDATAKEIRDNMSNYFVPAKFNYHLQNLQERFSAIDENIPLMALEQEFILSIDDLIPNRIKGAIEFNFTRPLLRFKEMPIVDVPLNLNLSEQELIQLVTKVKNEFDNGSIVNPINASYGAKFEFKDLKDITPFKMTKENMAQAFFIYDLYQEINVAMLLHKNKLAKFKEMDIKEFEEQIEAKIKEKAKERNNRINQIEKSNMTRKKWIIDENKREFRVEKRNLQKEAAEKMISINKDYKEYSKVYHTMTILEDLAKLHDLTPYMCKQYLKFMRKYIDDLKYKELIIGTKDI